jgi:hypothetical protein
MASVIISGVPLNESESFVFEAEYVVRYFRFGLSIVSEPEETDIVTERVLSHSSLLSASEKLMPFSVVEEEVVHSTAGGAVMTGASFTLMTETRIVPCATLLEESCTEQSTSVTPLKFSSVTYTKEERSALIVAWLPLAVMDEGVLETISSAVEEAAMDVSQVREPLVAETVTVSVESSGSETERIPAKLLATSSSISKTDAGVVMTGASFAGLT